MGIAAAYGMGGVHEGTFQRCLKLPKRHKPQTLNRNPNNYNLG